MIGAYSLPSVALWPITMMLRYDDHHAIEGEARAHNSGFPNESGETVMRKISRSIVAAAAILMAGVNAGLASELPTYEVNGVPISPVQVSLLGAAHVKEQATVPASALSPHQMRVLAPRSKLTSAVVSGRLVNGASN